MKKRRSDYRSYLLRLWRVSGGGCSHQAAEETIWRASLQDALTDERIGFASLGDLFEFLRRETDAMTDETAEHGEARE
jgi:hypothetical protein